MYTTMKIRLKMNEEAKEYLLLYERVFHEELEILAEQMENKHFKICDLSFDERVAPKSFWVLHRFALKRYDAKKKHKNFSYKRSSSWTKGAFTIKGSTLTLNFGEAFDVQILKVELAMDNKEKQFLSYTSIVRIDLVHDEKFWFANFVTIHR